MTRLLLLGSGELGREVALEAARLGVEVVAADRYDGAPAMLVTPHRRVLDMTDPDALTALVEEVRPDLVVPEVEALATEALVALEEAGTHVVPTARATASPWTARASGAWPPRSSACRPRPTASPPTRRSTPPPWPRSARRAW